MKLPHGLGSALKPFALALVLVGSLGAFLHVAPGQRPQARPVELTNCPIDVHEVSPARVVVGYDDATFDSTTRLVTYSMNVIVWGKTPSSVKLEVGDYGANEVISLATGATNQITVVHNLNDGSTTITIENDGSSTGPELSRANQLTGTFDKLLTETTMSETYVAHDVANKDRVRFSVTAFGLTTGFIMQEV